MSRFIPAPPKAKGGPPPANRPRSSPERPHLPAPPILPVTLNLAIIVAIVVSASAGVPVPLLVLAILLRAADAADDGADRGPGDSGLGVAADRLAGGRADGRADRALADRLGRAAVVAVRIRLAGGRQQSRPRHSDKNLLH